MEKFLIFTDLDGTLIDHDTYEFADALPTLNSLSDQSIPVILCTSKTRAETEKMCVQMSLNTPFIVENGSAIFIPKGSLVCSDQGFIEKGNYYIKEFGTPYASLQREWREVKKKEGLRMRGFSEMSTDEIARLTGLPIKDARLSSLREYSEPFIFEDSPEAFSSLETYFVRKGLRITKGGRFFHLIGQNDKGRAVQCLKKVYEKNYFPDTLKTIGLGDSTNDVPMLKNVDIAVVIKRTSGEWEKIEGHHEIIYSSKPGPAGWAEEVARFLEQKKGAGSLR